VTTDQTVILAVLAGTILLFLWGRWRHDMVAVASLLVCVLAGLVPASEAFSGFGHPAVITVACVLVLSWGLQTTGAVDALVQRAVPANLGPTLTIVALTALGAALSAFMNNVGAMALLMPVAIQIAGKHDLTPGKVLMPLSFGTILGGMTTLIGTPPNLIVSAFREDTGMGSFGMFDFTPVGVAVAGAGVLFVAALGWRLVPTREQKGAASFDTGTYLTEARVTENGKAAGKTVREAEQILEEFDAQIVGLVRNEFRLSAPSPWRRLAPGDIVVIEAEPETLASVLSTLGLRLEEAVPPSPIREEEGQRDPGENDRDTSDGTQDGTQDGTHGGSQDSTQDGTRVPTQDAEAPTSGDTGGSKERGREEVVLQELVIMPTSGLIGRSAAGVRIRSRYGLNLLAISRQGRRTIRRLRSTSIRPGDVLLMQGGVEAIAGFAVEFGCVPLAVRGIHIPDTRKAIAATVVMAGAIAGAAFGLLPAAVSFAAGVLMFMVLRVVPLRKVYEAVDWPVIVLLAALIPVATATATTGAADLLARSLLDTIAQGQPVIALVLILVVTMTLSDFMNNAATAAVMCPIAIGAAAQLGTAADPFLMAVAIGASCAFLTPIGHQNNTLILGPGGFRFGDYWRLGLPTEIIAVAVSVPLLLVVWPL